MSETYEQYVYKEARPSYKADRKSVGPVSQVESGESEFRPHFEGFTVEQEVYIADLLASFDLPLDTIKTVRYIERAKIGGALAAYHYGTHVMYIGGPIPVEPYARFELTNTLFHETAHAVFDPSAHVIRDEQGFPQMDDQGQVQFYESLFKVYETPAQASMFYNIASASALQAIRTDVYIDGYQKRLGLEVLHLEAQIRLLVGAASRTGISVEEVQRFQAEAAEAMTMLQSAIHTLIVETGAIVMTNAMMNPQNLAIKIKAQKDAWDRLGIGAEDTILEAEGNENVFVPIDELAQGLLQAIYKTDAEGVAGQRSKIRNHVLESSMPIFGAAPQTEEVSARHTHK